MLKNYFTIAIRSFLNQKYYSLINTIGLAMGMASFVLIVLFIRDELSYEKTFPNRDRIYRLVENFPMGEHLSKSATVPFPTRTMLMNDFPAVTNAALMFRPSSWGNAPLMRVGDESYFEDGLVYAEQTLQQIYQFPYLAGDPATALTGPNKVVLTRSVAEKYFGRETALGKSVNLGGFRDLEVTGVMEDLPSNTHLDFGLLVSFDTFKSFFNNQAFFETQWTWVAAWMYFTVPDEAAAKDIEAGLPAFVKAHYPKDLADAGIQLRLQAANDVHLHSALELEFKENGNIKHIYLFSFIAALIILIAVINFMNLATSRSVKRAKEVGLRKVMGAQRQTLIAQFLGEAILTTLLSCALGILLIILALPWFNQLTGKALSAVVLADPLVIAGMAALAIAVGLAAGSYPALALSSFVPTEVLKGKSGSVRRGDILRKALVVTQFVISISLLICIGIVYKQLNYLHHKDLGFDKEQVIMADLTAFNQYPALRSELLKNHEVKHVTLLGATVPGNAELMENAFAPASQGTSQQQFFSVMNAAHDFEKLLNLEFIEGHGFEMGNATDSAGYIINESAAKAMGWTGDVVGRSMSQIINGNVAATGTVIGLVKDFHYRPLYEPIKPLVISFGGNTVSVKVQSADLQKTVAAIESVWVKQMNGSPFRYSFMDSNFDQLYRKEDKFSTTIQYFCALAIFIACLGLLGLSAYTAESRRKEIGIRKVNGASTFSLLKLLTAEFSLLVVIAFVIAVPIAWYFSGLWLANFAYKTTMDPFTFIVAGMISLVLAVITVSYHTLKAARGNPVESLRYE